MSIGLGPKVHIFAVPYQTNSNMVASATALRWRLDRFFLFLCGSSCPYVRVSVCVCFSILFQCKCYTYSFLVVLDFFCDVFRSEAEMLFGVLVRICIQP